MDEEELIVWQDVLDAIMSRRPDMTACPYCGTAPMRIEPLGAPRGDDGLGGPIRIICTKCRKYIEGTFGGY